MRIRPGGRDDRGATAVEYGLIIALVAVVIAAAIALVGSNLSGLYQASADTISDAVDGQPLAAGQPAAEQPAAEQPAAEQPAAVQPAAEQPAAEQPAAEQPAAEQPAAEQPAAQSGTCTPAGFDADGNDNDYKSPTCSKKSGSWAWQCSGGDALVTIDGRVTCRK